VAVEKVQVPLKQSKFWGYEMPRKLRKSFAELPNAILFFANFAEKSFSTPTPHYTHCQSKTLLRRETRRAFSLKLIKDYKELFR